MNATLLIDIVFDLSKNIYDNRDYWINKGIIFVEETSNNIIGGIELNLIILLDFVKTCINMFINKCDDNSDQIFLIIFGSTILFLSQLYIMNIDSSKTKNDKDDKDQLIVQTIEVKEENKDLNKEIKRLYHQNRVLKNQLGKKKELIVLLESEIKEQKHESKNRLVSIKN